MDLTAATLSEQIFSMAASKRVQAGDLVIVSVDRCMSHDSLTPEVIDALNQDLGASLVSDPDRVVVVMDHVAPASSVQTANAQVQVRQWVQEQGISHFYDVGVGVCHQVMIEKELVLPGQIALGTDSHATAYGAVCCFGTGVGSRDMALTLASGHNWFRVPETIRITIEGAFRPWVSAKDLSLYLCGLLGMDGATYQAVEFHGADGLSLASRETLASMTTELGAKAGLVPPTGEAMAGYQVPEWLQVREGARYARSLHVDLSGLSSQVSVWPHVDTVVSAGELEDVTVDQVLLGTCTNGRLQDLQAAARVLHGRRVHPRVRMLIVPASHAILQAAVADGTLAELLAAGATIGTPGCGPCIGRHMGVIGAGETCFSTANRNFRGRMGDPEGRIYLGSPEAAAAAALTGHIADPADVWEA
jgi:methanogen homoaconitase large subunit